MNVSDSQGDKSDTLNRNTLRRYRIVGLIAQILNPRTYKMALSPTPFSNWETAFQVSPINASVTLTSEVPVASINGAGQPPVTADVRCWFEATIGKENVLCDENSKNRYGKCTLPVGTTPGIIVRPRDVKEVQQVILAAKNFGLATHTISCGKNWGYGDACAPKDGQLIIDLGRMNQIIEVNEELAYAVIEPGVSQGQLYDELIKRNSSLMLDATGAGPDASIVGNVLQRGFGHTPYGDRTAYSCNYQYITPDGKIHHSGFGDISNSQVGNVYPYGQGPCQQGMLAQNNSVVVTRMTIWMMPRPERIEGFAFKVDDHDAFFKVIDRLRPLCIDETINGVIHLANDLRVMSSQPWMKARGPVHKLLSKDERSEMRKRAGVANWNALGGIYGTRSSVADRRARIRSKLRGVCSVHFFRKQYIDAARRAAYGVPLLRKWKRIDWLRDLTSSINDVMDLLHGRPCRNHLEGAFFRNRPESGQVIDAGLIWKSPVIPFLGSDAKRLIDCMESIANDYGFDLPITISPVKKRSAICVTNLCFDKSSHDESLRAEECGNELRSKLLQFGYPLYRESSI
ncbi:4-cresol dehydrogenase [hydroxylating] flavoprotein subunit [Rubripirellula amarantea]|uniref:4-cresol dehydrogenase [hydroxylating] flavoprotein subunit n=1 Tax=Rubripirellula amarantea TaxID=2527999 RepID=A0A5C5WXP1_9BACT|nr:FAD-dependent oxidoreductase [Rubripirellula amarantea]TWT54655.1 4-cresol dehydrogenase [hydroxylating] flavoprotein subunit [Rubripirellula amarantea]